MGKFALIVLAVIAVVLWLRYKTASAAKHAKPKPAPAVEQMVACAACGVHLPANDALRDSDGRPYCGKTHLDAAAGKK